ncbi:3-hydroxyacyl-CoA dehydrogenase family protein [Carnobacterium maltaromaticum]|uniref:3-hydroxyacyl-CoA dehydrogenase family protein n=1 Tax=Carnobacterium maltaromaticum TaxID=2751 RepID=UPI0039AFE031
MKIKTVTVVGANGNMGANVSGIIAGFGNAKVYLISRRIEDSVLVIDKICNSVKADDIRSKLHAKTYDDLSECVSDSDWVFESVAEDKEIKMSVTKQIFTYCDNETIVTSGTSGLSINEIANLIDINKRSNYFGTHFFNPPYNLNLCEVIYSEYTNKSIMKEFSDYLKNTLFRTVVLSKDSPAFLANRVGFQFINRAMLLSEEYQNDGGIDYIDYLFQGITGRGMAPLVTANFVGLDIHQAIISNIYLNTSDFENSSFKNPKFLNYLLNKNYLGIKTKIGLYEKKVIDGHIYRYVFDIKTNKYRLEKKYNVEIIEKMKILISKGDYSLAYSALKKSDSKEANIIKSLLAEHVVYSLLISKEVSNDVNSIDDALVNGFNWIPPQAFINLIGGVEEFQEFYLKYASSQVEEKELKEILKQTVSTNYDYRKFLKA